MRHKVDTRKWIETSEETGAIDFIKGDRPATGKRWRLHMNHKKFYELPEAWQAYCINFWLNFQPINYEP